MEIAPSCCPLVRSSLPKLTSELTAWNQAPLDGVLDVVWKSAGGKQALLCMLFAMLSTYWQPDWVYEPKSRHKKCKTWWQRSGLRCKAVLPFHRKMSARSSSEIACTLVKVSTIICTEIMKFYLHALYRLRNCKYAILITLLRSLFANALRMLAGQLRQRIREQGCQRFHVSPHRRR